MSVNEASKFNLIKKDRNAVKRQVRFEKSKKYQLECENSLKLQEKYLKGLEDGKKED